MINSKNFLGQCLLAAALAGGALSAMAAPTNYHVSVNTAGLTGTGTLDFYMASATTALPLTATLSNFSGNFGAVDSLSGDYTAGPGGSYMLVNGSGYNDLARFLALGGLASFDVTFSGAFIDSVGSEGGFLSLGLYDANGDFVSSNEFGNVTFDLTATDPTTFAIATDALSTVSPIETSAVPEPSAMLLMMTGLGLLGFTARRKAGY